MRQRSQRPGRDPWTRRIRRRSMGIAGIMALITATGAAAVTSDAPMQVAAAQAHEDVIAASLVSDESTRVSRDAERVPLATAAGASEQVEGVMYAVASLEIRSNVSGAGSVLATVDKGKTVEVTGKTRDKWTQIMHKDRPRWVLTEDISKNKPKPKPKKKPKKKNDPKSDAPKTDEAASGVSAGACHLGSGVEQGLQPDTIRVYRAVCARFPQITRYGGAAGRGEHGTGHALDIMVSGPLGWDVANFLKANRQALGVSYLIYEQKIWTVQRGGEGWRSMSSRGGATANHYDHVHVTTYGSAGSS